MSRRLPRPSSRCVPRQVASAPLGDATDAQLLGLLWGLPGEPAVLEQACRGALATVGGLVRAGRLGPSGLRRELPLPPGAPSDAGERLAAALELGRRALAVPLATTRPVRGVDDLEPFLRGWFAGCRKEVFLVVLLDAKNRPLRAERVSEGCLTWAVVHPREVYGPAVRESAGAIVVAHNHPSGDPEPSRQDVEVTERLARVGELLGIPLLDHVIVGVGSCVSLRARGHLASPAPA